MGVHMSKRCEICGKELKDSETNDICDSCMLEIELCLVDNNLEQNLKDTLGLEY